SFLEACAKAEFQIDDIEVKPLKRKPTAPFTTSTLQQEASRKLGFAVKRTMSVAQRLYEAGHITYMRTDSIALSEVALASIAQEIEKNYGKNYLKTRRYKNKNSNAQEAHEAIRPTYIDRHTVTSNRDEQRLYELIWKRTIASQMAEAIVEKTTVKIGVSTVPDTTLNAVGEVLKFDGFLKVYLESKDDDEEEEAKGMLPPLKKGQFLNLNNMTATERFTRPPARFTEASLVKKLEELGIGRPSTYAPTISKIMEEGRGYVTKETRDGVERSYKILKLQKGEISKKEDTEITGAVKNRLFPSDLGITVSDFLSEHFGKIMDYNFTAGIEEKFDKIAAGNREWTAMLEDFYKPFHANVEDTLENAERATGERILGKDPETGRTLLTRITRNGPVAQIGTPEELGEEEKPKYANLRPTQSIETITFEEAMKLFELPRVLGSYKGAELSIGVGRYGPYVKYGDKKYVSIPKGEDPLKLSEERALELVAEKEKADAPVGTYKGMPITKGKGRFGPFLKWNDLYVNVPRRYDFENISLEDMHELIEAKVQKEANRYIHQWKDEGISVENGRWGPFIKFKKKNVKIPKKEDGSRVTSEEAKDMTLEDVKKLIEAEIPNAFAKKKKAPAKKKTAAKKTTSKKKTTKKK
ncbi:MAG: DNA topoisomerase, partial [Saprospiraceae bacterium]|nr:DNA topoisomerase [Saprospiraceae bacterium]